MKKKILIILILLSPIYRLYPQWSSSSDNFFLSIVEIEEDVALVCSTNVMTKAYYHISYKLDNTLPKAVRLRFKNCGEHDTYSFLQFYCIGDTVSYQDPFPSLAPKLYWSPQKVFLHEHSDWVEIECEFSDFIDQRESHVDYLACYISLKNPGDYTFLISNVELVYENFVGAEYLVPVNLEKLFTTGLKLPQVSDQFELFDNYPNPFNPTTIISYSLSKPSRVSLIIYNNKGQKIIDLVDDYQSMGNYNINFDASRLPSGIYFYHLKTSTGFSQTKQMMLVK